MQAASTAASSCDRAIAVRRAEPSDLARLAELEAKAFVGDRLSRRSLAALMKRRSARLLVACRGDTIDGYAVVLTRRGSRVARLYSLAVDPEAAGQGIGSRLLAAAETEAGAAGADRLRLEVRSDNRPAVSLYERRGYAAMGRREAYYEDGAPAFRYEREIASRKPAPANPPRAA